MKKIEYNHANIILESTTNLPSDRITLINSVVFTLNTYFKRII